MRDNYSFPVDNIGFFAEAGKMIPFEKKKELCQKYFDNLCNELKDTHALVRSCNGDFSAYLVPKGTEDQISYSSKPVGSYRISDHWNWFANIKKCHDERYIQCFNADMPRVKPRLGDGKPSKPVFGVCVAYFGADQKYHHVYGEIFDHKTKHWQFCETIR